MKLVYVLLDGAADRRDERINYTTPLRAAVTKNLDTIASRSALGMAYSVGKGVAPESDIAVFSMLGYTFKEYPGRGVVEAVGSGLEFKDGMLAMRANFATVKGGVILDRRAGRNINNEERKELERIVNSIELEGAELKFKTTVGHRAVLIIKADFELSSSITNTDPGYRRVNGFGVASKIGKNARVAKCHALRRDRASILTAKLVNEFTEKATKALSDSEVNLRREKEGKLQANCILLRDPGNRLPRLESFKEKYGLEGTAFADMPAELGIAKLTGMRVHECTGMPLKERARLLLSRVKNDGVYYIHIKGPDEFGHDGDVIGKKNSIEKIDLEFFSEVKELEDARFVISCDHATPCKLMMHSDDPVPVLVSGESQEKRVPRFAEEYARFGLLGIRKGSEIISKVLGS